MQMKRFWPLLGIVLIIISGYFTYNYSKGACAYRYTYAYNHEQLDKLYSYYDREGIIKQFDKEEVINFLRQETRKKDKIKANELTLIRDKKTKKCFVEFPYKLENINVLAPVGSDVYVNNKRVVKGVTARGVEIKNLLPGNHIVTIEYYNNMHQPFVKQINIPKENLVESPYPTHDILVSAPPGTWVTIGHTKKQSKDEEIVFNNMLAGQYDLQLSMEDQKIQVFSQKTQIDSGNTSLNLEKISGNQKIKDELQNFFSEFNKEYKQGIIEKNTEFLHKFSTKDINENIISDFKMWYLDNKEIVSASSLMEVRDIYPISGNSIKVSVLETVYLTNKEKDSKDNYKDQEYRVVIEWDYTLLRSNSTWKIVNREILQSIVAYKNEEGNWIKY